MGCLNSFVTLFCCVLMTFLVSHRAEGREWFLELIEDCMTNEEDRRIDIRNLSLSALGGGKFAILGLAEINLQRISLMSIELTKCASKQEPETCKYFTTVKYKDACKLLDAKGEMWSSFFDNAEPPMRCPIKGSYNFENSKMDGDAAGKGMPGLEGFYWRSKTTVFVQKKQVGCVLMEFTTV